MPPARTLIIPFALIALVSPSLKASQPPMLVLAKGPPLAATLVSVSSDREMNFLIDGHPRRLQADDVVAWGAPTEPRATVQLLLADGGIVCLANDPLATTEQDRLIAVSDTFGKFSMPLKDVAGMLFHSPIDPQSRDRLAARLEVRPPPGELGADASSDNRDRLFLENGDEFRGRIMALTAGAVEFEAEIGAITVELERVTALAFNPLPRSKPVPGKAHLLIGFTDGSVVSAQSMHFVDGRTELGLGDRSQPLVTDEEPVFVQPVGGTIQYLSDLPAASYKHIPYLGSPREYRLDANADQTRLRAGGRIYPKGVGMHSAARLTWQLKKTYRRFAAELAIDDQTGGRGSVVFRVFSASREVYKSPVVRGGDAPLPISVDIRDARQLSLVVDYADRADVLDRADWLNARLIP